MPKYEFQTTPYQHQKDALAHLQAWRRPYFFWRMEMGTGKTKVALDNAAILFERGDIDCLVIVAPKTIVGNWVSKEIPKHLPSRIRRRVLAWRSPSSRTKAWKREYEDLLVFRGLAVFVVNVEAFSRKTGAETLRNVLKRRETLLVLDESTTVKTPKADRTKSLCRVAKLAKFRRAMTGSSILPMELFSQCQFLEPGLLGHASFQSFRSHFGELEERHVGNARTIKQLVGYRNVDELGQMLSRFSYHVTKAECLDLPEKLYTTREVEMTPKQERAYLDMKEDFRVALEEGEINATIVLAQITRLQQILCGWVPLDSGEVVDLPENRTAALLETLEQAEGGAIIWAPFKRDQARIAARIQAAKLGPVVVVNGDTPTDARERAVDDFQAGRVRFWVGGTKVGGMGLTLTAARTVVYWSNIWSLEQREQSEDRAHRIGQTNHVTYVDLVSPGTVDEKILAALTEKLTLAEALASASKSEVASWV